jgi:hypothetical protein
MLVMTGCDFKPLIARQLALLLLNPPLPPDVKIPPIEIATVAQKRVPEHGGARPRGPAQAHRELSLSIVVDVGEATEAQSR